MNLLAILDVGDCYGHQLRAELERRTPGVAAVNVGQIYSTLDRLKRDGLVQQNRTDAEGRALWSITPVGSAQVQNWLSTASTTGTTRDEVAVKVALAVTLPGADALRVVEVELAAARERMLAVATPPAGDGAEATAAEVIWSADQAQAHARVRWLEQIHGRLVQAGGMPQKLPVSAERPRRGRPTRRP